MFDARMQKAMDKKISLPTKGFAGQHTSQLRQNKNKTMKALGIKTGKAYRKYVKKLNNENREAFYE
jgi:hypothetical protein